MADLGWQANAENNSFRDTKVDKNKLTYQITENTCICQSRESCGPQIQYILFHLDPDTGRE